VYVQVELDTRADSTAANSRVQNTVSGLQDEIKSLKNQLQRTESEKESLENQARLSGSSGIFGAGGFGGGHGGNGKEKATIFALENELQALRRENLKLMEQDRSVSPSHALFILHASLTKSWMSYRTLRLRHPSDRERRPLSILLLHLVLNEHCPSAAVLPIPKFKLSKPKSNISDPKRCLVSI